MTSDWHEIREIDLMAYADGLLNDDTKHKAAIEAYLAGDLVQEAKKIVPRFLGAVVQPRRIDRLFPHAGCRPCA
jgi:hypothetical protein